MVEEHESSALLAAKRRDLVDEMCASEDRLKEELSRLSEIKQLESNEVGQLRASLRHGKSQKPPQ